MMDIIAVKNERTRLDCGQNIRKYGTIYAFLLLFFNIVFTRNFASMGTLWNLTIQVLPTMLTALGMVLVISSGGIDISVGSVMAISAVTSGLVLTGKIPFLGTSTGMAVLAALVVALALGLFNGVFGSVLPDTVDHCYPDPLYRRSRHRAIDE